MEWPSPKRVIAQPLPNIGAGKSCDTRCFQTWHPSGFLRHAFVASTNAAPSFRSRLGLCRPEFLPKADRKRSEGFKGLRRRRRGFFTESRRAACARRIGSWDSATSKLRRVDLARNAPRSRHRLCHLDLASTADDRTSFLAIDGLPPNPTVAADSGCFALSS